MEQTYIISKDQELFTIKNVANVMSFDNSTILYGINGEVLAVVPKSYLILLES